jgi:predicted nucleic acid-binding protein
MVIADTSVLTNFLRIDRVDLLAHLSSAFLITDHVETKITEPNPGQRRAGSKVPIVQGVTIDEMRWSSATSSGRALHELEGHKNTVGIEHVIAKRCAIDKTEMRVERTRCSETIH